MDFQGNVWGRGTAPHDFEQNLKPGESEQDPQTWVKALGIALKDALREANIPGSEIVTMEVSGQQHGFVPLDREGLPVRPAKLWNDTSTVEETEAIVEKLGGKQHFIDTLGISLAVGFTASKILWLKRKELLNYKRLATILLPHNYLNYYLTGTAHMEYGDASGTGLMDIRKRQWLKDVIQAIDPELEEKLPALQHPCQSVGYLKDEIASRYGMEKVLVSSGGGDNMMGAIGTGNVKPGICTLSLGTSGTIYTYFPEPFIDPEGEIAAFCDSTGGWLPLLCTMNATNATESFKALFRISNEKLEEWVSQAPPGAEDLLFLPFIEGERVPVLPHARGVIFGLDRRTFKASHIARSIVEGTILNLGYGFQRMKHLGMKPDQIRATGGGSRSRIWLQIAANIFQIPVVTLKEKEGAAFGAAIQSIWNYLLERGEKVFIEELCVPMIKKEGKPVNPQPETFSVYEQLQERFNSLWQTLKPEFRTKGTAYFKK